MKIDSNDFAGLHQPITEAQEILDKIESTAGESIDTLDGTKYKKDFSLEDWRDLLACANADYEISIGVLENLENNLLELTENITEMKEKLRG